MNTLILFLKSFFEPKVFLGVLPDTRSDEEKELDPLHEEVAAGMAGVQWTMKIPAEWKHVDPLRSQNLESSDCCAFSGSSATQADQALADPLSAGDLYDRRSNYPDPGMIPFEAEKLSTKYGIMPDAMLPSDNLTEEQLNVHVKRTPITDTQSMKVAGGIPTQITNITIDTVAAVIAQGLHPRLCFHFTQKEWTAIPQNLGDGAIHHRVFATDFSIVNGKKCIIIQDSCFIGTTYNFPHGLRAITEDFLLQRCFSATYVKPAGPVVSPGPIQHIFTVDIQYGENNNEVTLLQTKLHTLGFFNVTPTGYFGGLTKQAVIAYQASQGLPQTGYVGTLTRAKLNS